MMPNKFPEATARPWTLYTKFATLREPYQIQDADGATVAIVLCPNALTPDEADDNAALMLAAVNSYDNPQALRKRLAELEGK